MTIVEDKRKVVALWFEDDSGFGVGKNGVTKIIAYGECGQMAFVPWFEVWKDDVLTARVNGAELAVVQYEVPA